jgi:hypothetical protein
VHDSTAPPILGQGWPEPVPDVHLQDLPLPEDPWHGWIPDPPEDWLIDHDEEQQWFAEVAAESWAAA